MNYNYLVPANSKKQGLVFGLLTPVDLAILLAGIALSFILFLVLNVSSLFYGIIAIAPALIAAFLIFPIPNYHNTRVLLREIYRFYFVVRKKYVWRGWCYKYDEPDESNE